VQAVQKDMSKEKSACSQPVQSKGNYQLELTPKNLNSQLAKRIKLKNGFSHKKKIMKISIEASLG